MNGLENINLEYLFSISHYTRIKNTKWNAQAVGLKQRSEATFSESL